MEKIGLFKVLVLFFILPVYSQSGFIPGFVITHEMDTLHGKVAYVDQAMLREGCQFIREGETNPVTWSPDDLYGFGFSGGRFFVSREVELITAKSFRRTQTETGEAGDSVALERVFLELLAEGAANLYKYSQGVFFAEKDGTLYQLYSESKETDVRGQVREGQIMAREVRKYIGVLQFLMSDCPGLGSRIHNQAFREPALADLFIDYSECRGMPARTFKEIRPKTEYTFMVKGGVRVSAFYFNAELKESMVFDGWSFGNPLSPQVMGLVSASNRRWGQNLSFEAGLYWASYKMADSLSYREGAFDHFHRVDMEFHEIGIPLGASYTFVRPGVKPYMGTGIMFIFNATKRFDWHWEQVYGELYTLHDRPDNLIKTLQFGMYLNGGLEWPVFNNKASLLTELSFHFTNGIINRNSSEHDLEVLQEISRSKKMAGQFSGGLKF